MGISTSPSDSGSILLISGLICCALIDSIVVSNSLRRSVIVDPKSSRDTSSLPILKKLAVSPLSLEIPQFSNLPNIPELNNKTIEISIMLEVLVEEALGQTGSFDVDFPSGR